MGRFIVKIKDQYFEYGTICDAPTTYGLTRKQMLEYLIECEREESEKRLDRVDKVGHSIPSRKHTVESLLSCNRAGENETELTVCEIYERYQMPDQPDEGDTK